MVGIFLVTRPQAAGKSTVSALLAGRFERGVHPDGDAFRRFIVTGRADIAFETGAPLIGTWIRYVFDG